MPSKFKNLYSVRKSCVECRGFKSRPCSSKNVSAHYIIASTFSLNISKIAADFASNLFMVQTYGYHKNNPKTGLTMIRDNTVPSQDFKATPSYPG